MPQYQVRVDRTSVRTRIITIEADTAAAALDKALEHAGNYIFFEGSECGVEYDGEVL